MIRATCFDNSCCQIWIVRKEELSACFATAVIANSRNNAQLVEEEVAVSKRS